jgi:hypothetical protein
MCSSPSSQSMSSFQGSSTGAGENHGSRPSSAIPEIAPELVCCTRRVSGSPRLAPVDESYGPRSCSYGACVRVASMATRMALTDASSHSASLIESHIRSRRPNELLRDPTWALQPGPSVEVKGLEPSASTLRMSGSRRFDQDLSDDFPGGGFSIPSGSLTIHLLPSR